jgi:hypothetical protein
LTPPLELCVDRVIHILKSENISITDDQQAILQKFVKNNYPDLRKIINELQKFCSKDKLQITDAVKSQKLIKQIWALTTGGHVLKVRKFIIENEEQFSSDYPMLLKMLFDHADSSKCPDSVKKMHLVIIAEALYRSAFVMDQEINCYSCLVQLSDASS